MADEYEISSERGSLWHRWDPHIGDYAVTMQSALLKPGAISASGPSPAVMRLKQSRMWLCSELDKKMKVDEGFVKQITDGDMISGRGMYGNQDEFLPVGKLWLMTNVMPEIRHDDKGMWRRVVGVPFNASFTDKSIDTEIEQKLKATELSGMLNWALEGAQKYAKNKGLGKPPKASQELIAQLRNDVDTVLA